VMLGLSYPNVLAVNPVSYGVARQNTDSAYAMYGSNGSYGSLSSMNPLIGFDRMGLPIYASDASFYGGCSYSPFDMGWNLYNSSYGCGYNSGYSYGGLGGFGYGYGRYPNYGGYFGGGPVVVPVNPGSGTATAHGRFVNGKGYTQGSDGSASPRANSSQPSSSSAGSGSASPPPSSPPPPSPPPRTAEPKKP
jgi:hypothetical protein